MAPTALVIRDTCVVLVASHWDTRQSLQLDMEGALARSVN
jgi:hypothetical protein